MRRYEKHYNGIQIDDSSSHSTLQLSSHTIPASSSIPVRTCTTTYNNTYIVSTAAISFDTTTTTLPSNPFVFRQPVGYGYTTQAIYTTTANSRSVQQFQWSSHRRQCDDIYNQLGSYENPEFSGNDQYPLNPSLQQPQTGANGLNMHSMDRPCSRVVTPVNHDLRFTDQSTSNNAFHYSLKGFKLPDIMLPKFDGNQLEWNNWFQTAIGNNPNLTDVEKIIYLQSLCVDKAKNVVESYGTNSLQYIQAIEELIRRCGNPKFVVEAFNRELENFEQLHVNEPQTFVTFAAFLRKLVHNFEINNYTSDLNSSN